MMMMVTKTTTTTIVLRQELTAYHGHEKREKREPTANT